MLVFNNVRDSEEKFRLKILYTVKTFKITKIYCVTLQSMESQRVRHDLLTEQQQLINYILDIRSDQSLSRVQLFATL